MLFVTKVAKSSHFPLQPESLIAGFEPQERIFFYIRLFFSIKKKVKGGTAAGGSRTLPSSNSSPVHSVQPPPHSGKIDIWINKRII